jgi:hypothetical protein
MSAVAAATPCGGRAGSEKPGHPRNPCRYTWWSPGLPRAPAPTDSPVGSRRRLESASQTASQLLFQPCRGHVPAAGQRPNHHLIGLIKVGQHSAGDMPEPARDPMAFDCRTHRFGNDQTDARTLTVAVARPPNVNDDVGLHGANPVLHRRVKLAGPPHAVACGKHRQKPVVQIRQTVRGGPYGAGWTRRTARPGYASATGSHARGHGAGYSAGTSACPWPRYSPRCLWVVSGLFRPLALRKWVGPRVGRRWSCYWPARSPGNTILVRSRIADFRATV